MLHVQTGVFVSIGRKHIVTGLVEFTAKEGLKLGTRCHLGKTGASRKKQRTKASYAIDKHEFRVSASQSIRQWAHRLS